MPGPIDHLPANVSIVDAQGYPNRAFSEWLRKVIEGQVADILAAQQAADEAQAAVVITQAAVETVEAAVVVAQEAAEAAQATADAIVVPPTGTRTVSTDTTLTQDDSNVLVDASGGAVTITLLAAVQALTDITVKKIDASVNTVDVEPALGDDLNGSATPITLTTQFETRQFVSDGNDWFA